jgi:hypothetical protein
MAGIAERTAPVFAILATGTERGFSSGHSLARGPDAGHGSRAVLPDLFKQFSRIQQGFGDHLTFAYYTG